MIKHYMNMGERDSTIAADLEERVLPILKRWTRFQSMPRMHWQRSGGPPTLRDLLISAYVQGLIDGVSTDMEISDEMKQGLKQMTSD